MNTVTINEIDREVTEYLEGRGKVVRDLSEKGHEGTTIYGGQISGEEFNSELANISTALKYFDKMERTDSQIHSALQLVWLPVLAAEWVIEPASEDDIDLEAAALVHDDLMENDYSPWNTTLRNILRYLQYGFYTFEKVYQKKDGKIRLKELAPRKPKTIRFWRQNGDGSLREVEQWVSSETASQRAYHIPNEKLVIFTNDQEGNNWQGKSLLRSVYVNWKSKNLELGIDPMRHEKQGLGVPIVTLPEGFTEADKNAAISVCETFRVHDKGYVVLPPGFKFEIADMKAGSLTDIIASLQYHDQAIMANVLANFMELGKTESGNRALGETLGDVFFKSLMAVVHYVEGVCNGAPGGRRFIRELVDMNFNVKEYPKLKCEKISQDSLVGYGQLLGQLADRGFIRPMIDDENYFRRSLRLPERSDDEIEEIRKEEEEKKERAKALPEPKEPEEPEEPEPEDDQAEVGACDCGHVHFTEEGFWRPLTDVEKSIGLVEMDRQQRKFSDELVAVGDKYRTEMIRGLVDSGFNLFKEKQTSTEFFEKLNMIRVKKTGAMANDLAKKMREVYDYGKERVRSELAAQGIKLQSALEPLSEEGEQAKKTAKPLAEIAVAVLSMKLFNEFRKVMTRQWNSGRVNTPEIKKVLTDLSKNDFTREMKEKTTEMFGLGRSVEAQKHKDQIKSIVRSEAMDQNTCTECSRVDGMEFTSDSPIYGEFINGPYSQCEGRDLCRGLNIFLKGE